MDADQNSIIISVIGLLIAVWLIKNVVNPKDRKGHR